MLQRLLMYYCTLYEKNGPANALKYYKNQVRWVELGIYRTERGQYPFSMHPHSEKMTQPGEICW
jgi:hypothetical protein